MAKSNNVVIDSDGSNDTETDRIHIWPLCGKDENAIQVDGGQYISQDEDYYIM